MGFDPQKRVPGGVTNSSTSQKKFFSYLGWLTPKLGFDPKNGSRKGSPTRCTKHSNLASPLICTIFSKSNLTLALVLLPLSLLNVPQFPLDSKLLTDYLLTIRLFYGMPFQKNFANLQFILLTLINLAPLLQSFIYPHLNFTPS